jgi:hypothetical protein
MYLELTGSVLLRPDSRYLGYPFAGGPAGLDLRGPSQSGDRIPFGWLMLGAGLAVRI